MNLRNYTYVMVIYTQLEQEMDLTLEKKDMCKSALQQWTTVWVPSILQYAESCTGKVASAVSQAKPYCNFCMYNVVTGIISIWLVHIIVHCYIP